MSANKDGGRHIMRPQYQGDYIATSNSLLVAVHTQSQSHFDDWRIEKILTRVELKTFNNLA